MFALRLTTEKNVAAETTDLNDQERSKAQLQAMNLVIPCSRVEEDVTGGRE